MDQTNLLSSPKFHFPATHIVLQSMAPKYLGKLPKFVLPKTPQDIYAFYNSAGKLLGFTSVKTGRDFLYLRNFVTSAYGWDILNKSKQTVLYILPQSITFLEVCPNTAYKTYFTKELEHISLLKEQDHILATEKLFALLDQDIRGLYSKVKVEKAMQAKLMLKNLMAMCNTLHNTK